MRKIGLLGGTSWPSTIPYYEYLNREVGLRLGGYHTANLVLHNVNYHPIKSLYTQSDGWDKIPDLLLAELEELSKAEPDCIVICNNTLHKAVDMLEERGDLSDLPPIIHIVDTVGHRAIAGGAKSLLLLGTKFTMEDGFYADRLKKKFGLAVDVPDFDDRVEIQHMQSQIAAGTIEPEFLLRMKKIVSNYPQYDGVVLACTELPLCLSNDDVEMPVIDPIKEQCDAALEFALEQ